MIEILGHLANFLYTFGSSFKKQIYLRFSFIVAAIMEIIYAFFVVKNEPLWTIIIWSIPMMFINGYYFYKLLMERNELILTPEEEKIYNKNFSFIDKKYFKKILNLADRINFTKNDMLIEEKKESEYFYLFFNGLAKVKLNGNIIAYLEEGSFVGEMGFLNNSKSSASVFANSDAVVYRWNKKLIKELMSKDRQLENSINAVLSNALIGKIDKINSIIG